MELDTAGAPTAAALEQDLDYSSLPRRFLQESLPYHSAVSLQEWTPWSETWALHYKVQ